MESSEKSDAQDRLINAAQIAVDTYYGGDIAVKVGNRDQCVAVAMQFLRSSLEHAKRTAE